MLPVVVFEDRYSRDELVMMEDVDFQSLPVGREVPEDDRTIFRMKINFQQQQLLLPSSDSCGCWAENRILYSSVFSLIVHTVYSM